MRSAILESRAQPIINLARSHPSTSYDGWFVPLTAGGGNATASLLTGTPYGVAARRVNTAAGTPGAAGVGLIIADGNLTALVRPAIRYAMSYWCRSSVAQSLRCRAQYLNAAASAGWTFDAPDVTLIPNQWARLSIITTSPAEAAQLRMDLLFGNAAVAFGVNDTFDIAGAMVTEGSNLYPFSDGAMPKWRYLNGNSGPSIGYPPPPA
ncbi:hypothetical protein [Glaciihabitans sp. dw_435]|uniref:hypothetical protein n=1 Tax=Glaciihabitans sp. dw_435 TaxID=2720081 RepID=UPI001BD50FF7|nr:hypothetical protein [Glaciihabitans sp. dw_435]